MMTTLFFDCAIWTGASSHGREQRSADPLCQNRTLERALLPALRRQARPCPARPGPACCVCLRDGTVAPQLTYMHTVWYVSHAYMPDEREEQDDTECGCAAKCGLISQTGNCKQFGTFKDGATAWLGRYPLALKPPSPSLPIATNTHVPSRAARQPVA